MVLTERILLGALLVTLCATVNLSAFIPSSKTTTPESVTTTTEFPTTEESFSTTTSDEAQKEANLNRTENARSLDLDISKYTSSDFHNKVYDQETSSDSEKHIGHHEISKVHTTFRTSFTSQTINDFDSLELTTPGSKLFDERHKALQNEIKKTLDITDIDEEQHQVEKPLIKANKTNLDFVRYTNIVADDDVRNKTSIHRNYETEKGLNLNYESVYNQSETTVDNFKVHSAKTPLLNNKIENDKSSINISKRGFAKSSTLVLNSTESTEPQSNLLPVLETTTNHEQTQQENNIYPVLIPIPLTTTSSTTQSSNTKLYEMTENEFLSTTENTTFEVNNTSDEKFYEMTAETQTENFPTTEFNPTTTDFNILTTITTISNQVQKENLQESQTELERFTTTITDIPDVITEEATITTTDTNSRTTTELDDNPITHEAQVATENANVLFNNDELETTTTVPTTEYDKVTIQDATTEFDLVSTTLTSEQITEGATTTTLSSSYNQTNEVVTFESTTTTESTTELSSTGTTIITTIRTEEEKEAETTTYSPNAILKEFNETSTPASPVASINAIKKDNATVVEPDLDDLTDEVTDDDYIDIQNRKLKPTGDSKINQTKSVENSTVSQVVSSATTDVTIVKETTTKEISTEDPNGSESSQPTPDEESNSGTIIAIVLASVGALCLVLLAILLFVVRRRQKRFNYGQRCTPVSLDAYSMDNVSVYNSVRRKAALRGSKRSYGNPAFDDDTSVSHPVNFQALVRFANNTDDIKTEFDEIPQVNAKMNELPDGCDTKNRYANVIPLPESRVYLKQLDDDPTSDYINANYVTGPKGVRGYYIACQAPLHNTVNDFWRMIWEQQSKVILMVTHLFENGVEKCVDYLPPSEVVDCHRLFGDYQVTLKKREVKDKYIISSLQLKNMVSNSWREVTHLWYSGWPEKGVPEEENSIIAFLIEARSFVKLIQSVEPKENGITSTTTNGRGNPTDSSPVVVHCSPGTGRTGTVIACDIAIREFELRRIVDIPRIVYRIRRDRASSVQTKDQYNFIYKVISLYATKLTGGALDSI